jgi:VIT1/CCC1 family predicted Fe2+/Mn2+ transporter
LHRLLQTSSSHKGESLQARLKFGTSKAKFLLGTTKGRLVQKLQLLLMKSESRLTTRGCGAAAAFFCFFNGVFFFFGVFFFVGPFLFFCDVPGMSSSSCLFLQEGNELDY